MNLDDSPIKTPMKKLILVSLLAAGTLRADTNDLLRLTGVSGSPVQLRVENPSDRPIQYQFQWSTNLTTWQTMPTTNTLDAHSVRWVTPGVGEHSTLFIRAKQL